MLYEKTLQRKSESLYGKGIPRSSQSSQLAISLVRSRNFLYHSSQFAVLFLASSQFLTNYKVKDTILLVICGQFRKKFNFSKLTGKIYEIIEYSTFSSITNFQTVIFHTVSSTKSIPRNSQFLATRSDLWGRINCELRGIPVDILIFLQN